MKKAIAGILGTAVILIYFGQACSQDTAGPQLTSPAPRALSSSLAASPQTVLISTQTSIAASGGTPPYSYSILSGDGTLSSNIFSAPATAGTTFVKIIDAAGTSIVVAISSSLSGASTPNPTPTPAPSPVPGATPQPLAAQFVASTFQILQGYVPSCNIQDPVGGACVSAIHRYCANNGFATGFGPEEYSSDAVYFTCVPASAASVVLTNFTTLKNYHSACSSSNPQSDACYSAVHHFCIAQGGVSGFGPVEYNNDMAYVSCVNQSLSVSGDYAFSGLANFNSGCLASNPISGSCHSAIHGYCNSLNYTAGGFGPVDHNGDRVSLTCMKTN
jgi:hypothetical protein